MVIQSSHKQEDIVIKVAVVIILIVAVIVMSTAADQDIAVEASLRATGLGSAAVVDDGVVPTIDLRNPNQAQVAQQLWKAATEVGFFTVIGHGIPQSVIDDAFAVSADFFGQSVDAKQAQSPGDMKNNAGFEYFSQVRPSNPGVADQKESLQVTARKGVMDDKWPSDAFQDKAESLLKAAHRLASDLLDLLEPHAVPHVPPGTLAKSHTLWSADGQCTLRFLHYPAMAAEVAAHLDKKDDDQNKPTTYWRAGPHTDWSNITLLFQRMGESGLECCANPRTGNPAEMYWTAINPVEHAVAINVGDMLARWSDGKLYSNLHRVRLPADVEARSKPRYSIAFFAQSDKSAMITSQKNEPISAGDYILSRIKSNFSKTT